MFLSRARLGVYRRLKGILLFMSGNQYVSGSRIFGISFSKTGTTIYDAFCPHASLDNLALNEFRKKPKPEMQSKVRHFKLKAITHWNVSL